jgi:hypothetical protein
MNWSQPPRGSQHPPREVPAARSRGAWWRSISVRTLLAAAAGAVLAYFATTYFGGEKCSIGRSSLMLDPFGLLSRRSADYAEAPAQRLPSRGEGDYRAGYPVAGNADGVHRDQRGQPHGRWRKCFGPPKHPRCGPWHTGPIPEEE